MMTSTSSDGSVSSEESLNGFAGASGSPYSKLRVAKRIYPRSRLARAVSAGVLESNR